MRMREWIDKAKTSVAKERGVVNILRAALLSQLVWPWARLRPFFCPQIQASIIVVTEDTRPRDDVIELEPETTEDGLSVLLPEVLQEAKRIYATLYAKYLNESQRRSFGGHLLELLDRLSPRSTTGAALRPVRLSPHHVGRSASRLTGRA